MYELKFNIEKVYPTDWPTKLYIQRCEVMRDFPPKDARDDVLQMRASNFELIQKRPH